MERHRDTEREGEETEIDGEIGRHRDREQEQEQDVYF